MKAQKFFPLVVIAAGVLAYHNSLTGSFFHDDFQTILENSTIRHLWPIWPVLAPFRGSASTVAGRPFINLTLAVNYAISGYNVWSYHVVNLVVHILAGLTLYGFVRRTLLQALLRERFGAASSELALAIATLWVVHPMQTESVTYIVQRAESIMGLFYLLTLYYFIRGSESPRPRLWYGLTVAACALGMASKQVMVSAPLAVMLYDRAFLSGSFRHAWRQRWPVYLALSATWIVLVATMVSADFYATMRKVSEAHHVGRWTYLLTESEVIVNYLRWSVWPKDLPILVNTFQPGSVILPGAAILLLLGASVWALRENSIWGFVGAWFFMILAPTSSFLPSIDPIFLHRMYLPLAAVVSVVVMGLYAVMGRLSLAVFVVMAIGLGVLTGQENRIFSKEPHYNKGLGLAAVGRYREAIWNYEQALQITPNDPDAQYDLAVVLMRLGLPQQAINHYSRALQLKPDFAEAHNNLGFALAEAGRFQEAIGHCEQALRIHPYYAEAHNNLGIALAGQGKLLQAEEQFEQAVRIKADLAEAYYNLGKTLKQAGQIDEAIAQYKQALRIRPEFAEAHYNLGNSLLQAGRTNDAIRHYEHALRIKPDYAEAHYNLGVALEQSGKVEDAVRHWERALQIKPDFAEAQSELARLRGGNEKQVSH